ncbi:Uncharacterized protein TCM_021406 [Theobroma cacao]|uniref:Uncharacterized protein n=1 Tax=Theobroma cacao TaxID=3641 RepID=A0A061EQ50_THECC|nr:Uncharacterized protein TCM_021406 [Theobroma cacao]
MSCPNPFKVHVNCGGQQFEMIFMVQGHEGLDLLQSAMAHQRQKQLPYFWTDQAQVRGSGHSGHNTGGPVAPPPLIKIHLTTQHQCWLGPPGVKVRRIVSAPVIR